MRLIILVSLSALAVLPATGCELIDGPPSCPAISESRVDAAEDHPEYTMATEAVTASVGAREALEPDWASGDLQIRVARVDDIIVWDDGDCDGDDDFTIGSAGVAVDLESADGTLTLQLPARAHDADTETPMVSFSPWSTTDPEVLAMVPDTDLADGAQVGMVELEVADEGVGLYRTVMVGCATIDGCSDTTRHLLVRWDNHVPGARS